VWSDKVALSAEDEAQRSELGSRHDELAEQHNGTGEDLPDDVAAELDRIEAELASLEAKEEAWQPEDVAIAGVALTLAADGGLRAERGYVRAEDEPPGSTPCLTAYATAQPPRRSKPSSTSISPCSPTQSRPVATVATERTEVRKITPPDLRGVGAPLTDGSRHRDQGGQP